MNHEEVFQFLFDRTERYVKAMAARYSANCIPGPLTDTDELTQVVWTKLWEWIRSHSEVAEALCTPTDDAAKFINTFARCRLNDCLDAARASNRDVRLTKNASGETATGTTYLELCDHGELDSNLNCMLADIRQGLSDDSKRILDLLVNTPPQMREAFLESRTKLSEGTCVMTLDANRWGLSKLALVSEDGGTQQITWEGPLEDVTDTDAGRMTVTKNTVSLVLDLPSGLLIQIPLGETRGEWIQETVLPSQALLDPGIWSDFLGWTESKVYWSKKALTDAVTAFLEPNLS